MDPLTLGLIMGGVGAAKSELIDRPAADAERKRQAEMHRWSPWTGMQGNTSGIKEADPFGAALQGGLTGYMMGRKGGDGGGDGGGGAGSGGDAGGVANNPSLNMSVASAPGQQNMLQSDIDTWLAMGKPKAG